MSKSSWWKKNNSLKAKKETTTRKNWIMIALKAKMLRDVNIIIRTYKNGKEAVMWIEH